jgi:hypothetical protein
MLVIHFSHLCKVVDGLWWMLTTVNNSPTLRHLLILDKGWITEDTTLGQDINIRPFPVIHALQDSKCLSQNFEQLKNGTTWNRSSSSFSQVNWRNILGFCKQNIAYLLLVWYSQITLYMWYFWIFTKVLMILPSFCLPLKAYVEFR